MYTSYTSPEQESSLLLCLSFCSLCWKIPRKQRFQRPNIRLMYITDMKMKSVRYIFSSSVELRAWAQSNVIGMSCLPRSCFCKIVEASSETSTEGIQTTDWNIIPLTPSDKCKGTGYVKPHWKFPYQNHTIEILSRNCLLYGTNSEWIEDTVTMCHATGVSCSELLQLPLDLPALFNSFKFHFNSK